MVENKQSESEMMFAHVVFLRLRKYEFAVLLRAYLTHESLQFLSLCSVIQTLFFIMCAAVPASCDSDVPDCWICLPVLRHQDP